MKKYFLAIILVIILITALIIEFNHFIQRKEMIIIRTDTDSSNVPIYQNPSAVSNIGDPFVLKASDGKYYVYPTSARRGFRAWSSIDLYNWKIEGIVFDPPLDSWAFSDFWAPEVVEYNGTFYMYYSARWVRNATHRIGVAVSQSPTGPFKDVFNQPMFDFGYAVIDASVFMDDDGRKYLYFARDCSENVINGRHESHIYGIKLNDDMVTVVGEPVLLLRPDQKWEQKSGPEWFWNEGPRMIKNNGVYYLMYSANYFGSRDYSIGYATSDHPLGPFTKYKNNPILAARNDISGPGHNSIVFSPDGSEMFAVYHTHTHPALGGGNRQINIDRMGFRTDGTLFISGPTQTKQPAPSGVDGYLNLSNDVHILTSPVKYGYSIEALNDGDIGMSNLSKKHEWRSDGEIKEPWIKYKWDKKVEISSLFIYGSPDARGKTFGIKLKIDDAMANMNIDIPDEPGKSAVVNIIPTVTDNIKLMFNENDGAANYLFLSEIKVIGKKE